MVKKVEVEELRKTRRRGRSSTRSDARVTLVYLRSNGYAI